MDVNAGITGATIGRPFRILSLDGGGILGAFTAGFLAKLEEELGRPVADYFDLIAGTSTGGIIAAALAMRQPAARVVKFYRDAGPAIFQRAKPSHAHRLFWWPANRLLQMAGLDVAAVRGPRYSAAPLAGALREVFQEQTIEASQSRLLLTSVDMVKGRPAVFKTPHLPNMFVHRHYPVRDVVLATAAAPTYFTTATIQGQGAYADGGLWANNPAMVAVAEAVRIGAQSEFAEDRGVTLESISCLSVGTGRYRFSFRPTKPPGVGWWLSGTKLFTAMMAGQSLGGHYQTACVLGTDRYRRIDFDPSDATWTIDNTDHIESLIELGEYQYQTEWTSLGQFFKHPAPQYRPHPNTGGPPHLARS